MIWWIVSTLMSWAWNYLIDHWGVLALFLIVTGLTGIAVFKWLARFGRRPVVAFVAGMVVWAWIIGYRTAPAKTIVRTETVTRTVPDEAALARLRKRIAALEAEKQAALSQAEAARRRAERAEAALDGVRRELAGARRELAAAQEEIKRLLAELEAVPPPVEVVSDPANAMCPRCGHRMLVPSGMKNERVGCSNCHFIMSARTAWARYSYMQNRQRSRSLQKRGR